MSTQSANNETRVVIPFGPSAEGARQIAEVIKVATERYERLSPKEKAAMARAQRRSFALAEAEFGTDADETAYREAVATGDTEAIARLDREAKARRAACAVHLDQLEQEGRL